MRYILRVALGVIFTFLFLALLLVSAFRFRLLSTKYWTRGVERSGIYQDLSSQIQLMQKQIDRQGGARIRLVEIVTEARVREVMETNVERLVDYLNGKTKELSGFLPLTEWNLPRELVSALPKLPWGRQMELTKVLAAMGFPADKTADLIKSITALQQGVGWLIWIWLGLLAGVAALLVGHFFLGMGKRNRIIGSGVLLLGCGLIAALIGWGGGKIGEVVATTAKDWPTWGRMLAAGLVGEFFALGKVAGLVTVGMGLMLFILGLSIKEAKAKEAKKKSRLAWVFQTAFGVVLGILLLFGAIAATVVSFGGKVGLKIGPGGGSFQIGQPTATPTGGR